jgi:hypothetical protein
MGIFNLMFSNRLKGRRQMLEDWPRKGFIRRLFVLTSQTVGHHFTLSGDMNYLEFKQSQLQNSPSNTAYFLNVFNNQDKA